MRRSLAVIVGSALLVSCGGDNNPGTDDAGDVVAFGGDANDPDTGLPKDPALAEGISISEIAVFQSVKSRRMLDGMATSSNVPIVADKPAMLRVYFKLDAGWTPHQVLGILDVTAGGQMQSVQSKLTPSAASTEDDLTSTFDFDLTADLVTTDATYAVRLVDPTMSAPPTSDPAPQRWPQDGTQIDLGAQSSGPQLKIVLVPIKYNADGSGRLPDTSQSQIDVYKNFMYSLYPTPKVDVTVHATVNWNTTISPGGSGWGSLMQYLANLHQQEAAKDEYYYGLFEPASSYGAFCGGGCVAGLSLLSQQPTDYWAHVSMGLGYSGDDSAFIMGQEVGHAHGRGHAPCGTNQGLDPSYPYTDGRIGVYGYSLIDKTLIAPTAAKDIMSYCQPVWISDYNYKAIFLRMKFINGASIAPGSAKAYYRWGLVDSDNDNGKGKVTLGSRFTLDVPPGGELKTVGGMTGYFYPFDHLSGGMLLVPAP